MKINKLKINSFGKIKNKEIELKNGINIFYGKNEAGKSTILNFIISSFYGISKNKRGKELSDFDKYQPWDGQEFSGKIEYELDDNKKFEIFRDFNKKNPKIFNENSEDISKEFNIDKKTGNEFFYEQTKIDEDLFLSTIGVLQNEVQLEKTNQNFLVQKLANLVGTGEDNVSFKKAIDRINKRQLDEIGTERSREKPINIAQKNIKELEEEKNNLQEYQDKKYLIQEEENNFKNNIEKLENKNNYFKEIKLLIENKKIEKEKINLKENIKKENTEKLNILNNKLEKEKNNYLENIKLKNNENNNLLKNKLNKNLILFFIILLLINFIILFIVKNNFKYICLLTIPIYLIISSLLKNKLNKKIKNKKINYDIKNNYNNINYENINNNYKNIENNKLKNQFDDKLEKNNKELELKNNEIINLENQINLLKNNNENLNKEIKELTEKYNLKNNLDLEKIKNKYNNLIEENNLFISDNLEKINTQIEIIQNELNKNKIELHKLKLDRENVEPKLDELSKIEEKLFINKENKNNLEKLNASMENAKECLIEAYEEMKNSITPKFTNNLSEIISKITNQKYNKIKFNDEDGLMVEVDSGDYIQIDKLSRGTIEQLYLSLRISMIDELSIEKLPIFLDETFAYYDDERLENTLKYLNNELSKRQILIFTCSQREKNALQKCGIDFNIIEI